MSEKIILASASPRRKELMALIADDFEIIPADIDEAVAAAHRDAVSGDIVTLSPACASFDAFPNFAARGNHYKELVNKL